jgi:hypothetical protein
MAIIYDGDSLYGSKRERKQLCATTDLDAHLPYPHYSDSYWNEARLIFGRQQKTEQAAYSDRLMQWDYAAHDRAYEAMKESKTPIQTPRWHQEWLSAYHGKPVALRYLMAGCNLATGYAYYFYGYDFA